MTKEELIIKLVEELKNEGFDVEGLVSEDGVMNGNYGLIKWWEFDDVEDDELKDTLIDIIKENEFEE
jgi:hypothetical protein